ncbi:hypothetical protein SRIMM317S_00107 [Streptomyces rimosus subsp. rimosus]
MGGSAAGAAVEGSRDAAKPGALCPQVPSQYAQVSSEEEDCLFLNVTAPAAVRHRPAPVLVWIHGDGSVGAGSFFDARRLADRGVVVVTVNYRLGVFGGFAHPGTEGVGDLRTPGPAGRVALGAAQRGGVRR